MVGVEPPGGGDGGVCLAAAGAGGPQQVDGLAGEYWLAAVHRHRHSESFFSSYSGTYWSYDACFTPARTDQLCQLVVAEGRTKCNTLSGNGKREVKIILFVVSSFFLAESPVSFVSLSTIVRPTSNPNVVFFKSKDHLSIYSKLISQVLTFRCRGQTVSYLSGDPFGKTSGANVSK